MGASRRAGRNTEGFALASRTVTSDAAVAKLLLLAQSFCWGLSWTAMRVALDEVSPWTMRFLGFSIGAATLVVLLKAQHRSLLLPSGRDLLHALVSGLIIVLSFGFAATFAQLLASTSRVIIVNYSMPVWGSVMAYFVLHERINARAAAGLALCIAGLGVLLYPLTQESTQEPLGIVLALVGSLGWAASSVYMKWARIKGDLLAAALWQMVVGIVIFGASYLVFNGQPEIAPLQWRTWGGILFNGIFGTGIAYFLWFMIIGRLTMAMASLGSLANPVVGVMGAAIILGDRPTVPDMIGFALIFGAAACVLIPQRAPAQVH